MTQSEIVHGLHEPLGTVKARIRRGMLNLKDTIPPKLEAAWIDRKKRSGAPAPLLESIPGLDYVVG